MQKQAISLAYVSYKMNFLIVDLPERKTLLDNADVVVEIAFEAENSREIKYTLVANRKDGGIELDAGFTKINGPMTKVRNFLKTGFSI